MWIIDAAEGPAWREVAAYPGKPDHLSVRMRFAPTGDGVAVAGVQVERTDGRALTARDLREVKLPPNWVLFGETAVRWYRPAGEQAVRSRRGPKGDDAARDRMVWDLYRQAVEVAPRAPVRWMLPQLGVSDATARRWIGRARQRAAELGWPQPERVAAGNQRLSAVTPQPTRENPPSARGRQDTLFCDRRTDVGTVHAIRQDETATLAEAAAAFLATLDHPESRGTRRAYTSTLRALRAGLGDETCVAELTAVRVGAWFTGQWGGSAPATWNRNLDAVRSAQRYWQDQGWMNVIDLTAALRRRKRAADRSRALSRADVERLLTREDIAIRERVMWRLLYETAARSAEVLRLDVGDLDLANRRATVTRKGGAVDVIVWQTGTARLLPRLLKGRKFGPVFLTDRRSRVALPPGDVDASSGKARLSYRRAAELFEDDTAGEHDGPWSLHQLRHSALTHDAENGASTAMLMTKSGHTSVASLARYARPSAEALARWQEKNDPARRR